jgi:hypothetical protein
VVSVKATGAVNGSSHVCRIGLTVEIPVREPYETTVQQSLHPVDMPALQPGKTVAVEVDPAEPLNVRINLEDDRALGSARQAAPDTLEQVPPLLSGTYAYKSSSGNSTTWTITPRGPGNANVAVGPGRQAPFNGTAQLTGQTWTMVVHLPDAVGRGLLRGGARAPGTMTFTWDATTLCGTCAARSDDGVRG